MKKLLIFFVLLSSISSFGQVQRPKMNPATLNWLLPFSITKQAYHAADSAVYSSPSGVIYKAPVQSGGATFDTTTYQATHHTWSKSNIFGNDTVGNAYPVLKRNANPSANGLFYWDNNSKMAVTSTKFTFIPSSSYFLQSYLTNGKFERGFTTVTGKPYFNYTDNSSNNCLSLDSTNNLTIGNAIVAGQLTINGGANPPFTITPSSSSTTFKVNSISNLMYLNYGGTNMYVMQRSQFFFASYNEPKYIYVQTQSANYDGLNLTIAAGGTYASRSNGSGGILYLKGGSTNNAGYSSIRLQRYSRTSSSGTTANTARDAFIVPSDKPLSNNTATTLFTIPFPADSATYGNSVSGKICYAISVRGTDGVQSMSGVITFAGVEYSGTVTTNIAADISRTALSSSTLTLTPTLTYAAGVWTVQVNSNSGLTTPVTKITYSVELGNNGASITQN